MQNIEVVQNLVVLTRIIKKGDTGSVEKLSSIFGTTPRNIHNWINILRRMGAEIKWDAQRKTYYFNNRFSMVFYVKINKKKEPLKKYS